MGIVLSKSAPYLKKKYFENIVANLSKSNAVCPLAVPKLEKIVLSMGLGKYLQTGKSLDAPIHAMKSISGQMPLVTKARSSIAGFKLREGMDSGLKVTLRGNRMYEFLERLIYVAMPRIRDFRGVSSKNFDGCGNFSMGVSEVHVFPEVDYDKVDRGIGMNISIVTNSKTDSGAKSLLSEFAVPFF
jgi:large subunit ribosomal protein L5